MPVPFAYFHATKLLLLSALLIVSYSLVEIDITPGSGFWNLIISMVVFTVISGINIGLQAIAIRMSDPFGDDDTDFNIEAMLANAYNNVMELMVDKRALQQSHMPHQMINPLRAEGRGLRRWERLSNEPVDLPPGANGVGERRLNSASYAVGVGLSSPSGEPAYNRLSV